MRKANKERLQRYSRGEPVDGAYLEYCPFCNEPIFEVYFYRTTEGQDRVAYFGEDGIRTAWQAPRFDSDVDLIHRCARAGWKVWRR